MAAQLAGASAGGAEPLQVHSYASQVNDVDSVNSHWFETGDGVVLIDAQRLLPEAKRALAHLRATTDAPVCAIVVTHAHTDHYGGLPVWTAAFPAAQIYADAATLDSIRSDGRGFIAMRNERHGGRFAGQDALTRAVADAEVVEAGETIAVGGAALAFDVLGPSEAAATVTVTVEDEDVAFVGDLVNVGAPAVPFEDVDGWLDQLDALAGRYDGDDRLYIGHGSSPAGVAAALEDDGVLDAAETGRVVFDLEAAWPFLQGVAGNTARGAGVRGRPRRRTTRRRGRRRRLRRGARRRSTSFVGKQLVRGPPWLALVVLPGFLPAVRGGFEAREARGRGVRKPPFVCPARSRRQASIPARNEKGHRERCPSP